MATVSGSGLRPLRYAAACFRGSTRDVPALLPWGLRKIWLGRPPKEKLGYAPYVPGFPGVRSRDFLALLQALQAALKQDIGGRIQTSGVKSRIYFVSSRYPNYHSLSGPSEENSVRIEQVLTIQGVLN